MEPQPRLQAESSRDFGHGHRAHHPPGKTVRCLLAAAVMGALAGGANAQTQNPTEQAHNILKAMSDYLARQKTVSAVIDTSIEVITPELQKIQFDSTSQVLLDRPGRLRVSRTGGYANVAMNFDGKTLTLYAENIKGKGYAQVEAPGSVDQVIDRLRNEYGAAIPGADLLETNAYPALTADVIDAKYIGHGIVNGIECEQLAFRNADTDWQIWVQLGADPIPRKYVITSKAVAAAPQYTLLIRDWKTGGEIPPEAFAFTVPPNAAKVTVQELMADADEVPAGVAAGGKP